jgi:hypothetical protein
MWMLKNWIILFIDITPNRNTDMKRVIFACTLILGTMFSEAQSWNPYVSQGIMSPLLPGEFKGSGVASFNLGNTGSSAMVFDRGHPGNNLSLVISMSDGVPDKKNPLAALGGPGVSYFDWTYDASSNTYKAIQKRDIPGYFQTTVTVGYLVNNNSSLVSASNGFKIALQPPSYLGGSNTTQDDVVSSYTFTRAFDYGDAPESYGAARHEIDLNKDPATGFYTRFIVLGKLIDQETVANYSPAANSDDTDGINDDDGVVFPPLTAGSTVTIPVVVTAYGESFGILNAWFDWNGDGDFNDAGEKVNGTPMPIYSSGTYYLSVVIPGNAVTNQYTFARFRIGTNTGPQADNAWGEAEDYRITVYSPELTATTNVVNSSTAGETTGSVDLTVTGGKTPYTFVWSNGSVTEDIANLRAGTYTVVVRDAANKTVTASATIIGTGSAEKTVYLLKTDKLNISVYPNPVTDKYYVDISREGKYRLEIINAAGSTVFAKIVQVTSGNGRIVQLSRDNLVTGPYILRITGMDNEILENVKIMMVQQ